MKSILIKKYNGITLIALVITIIVLIILAGISINAIVGKNNIIARATDAQILSNLSSVKDSIDIYKINKHLTDNELVKKGLLKEVFINDTYRTIAIVTNLEELNIDSKLGHSGEEQEASEVATILDLYDVYGIDLEDGTLYYIKDGIWSIDGKKIKYTTDDGEKERI